jgi:hypothetical protein
MMKETWQSERIVVVADSERNKRQALARWIERCGWTVEQAAGPLDLIWLLDSAAVVVIGELRDMEIAMFLDAIGGDRPRPDIVFLSTDAAGSHVIPFFPDASPIPIPSSLGRGGVVRS